MIRLAGASDAESVAEMAREVFLSDVAPGYGEEGQRTFLEFCRAADLLKRMAEGGCVFMEEESGRIRGVMEISATGSHLRMLFVKKEFQNRDIGLALIGKFFDYARECGGRDVTVNAAPDSTGFYEKAGFKATDGCREKSGIRFVPMKKSLEG